MTTRFTLTRSAARTLVAQAAVGLCVTATIVSTGCRSGRPSLNLFGMNREPSAEMLAGSGPTATYPTPPSASATPTAIASIAGGTAVPSTNPGGTQYGAPAGMAGNALANNPYATQQSMPTVNSTPGVPSTTPAANPYGQIASKPTGQTPPNPYALPGSNKPSRPVDYSAAAANGYAAAGYQYGTKPTAQSGAPESTPAPTSMPPVALPTAGQSLASSGSSASSTGSQTKPSAYAIPGIDALGASSSKPAGQTSNESKPSGFTLPGGMVPELGSQPTSSATASNKSTSPATSPAVSAISLPASMSDTLEGAKNQFAAAGQTVADATKTTANTAAEAAAKATSPAFQTATGMGSNGSVDSVKPTGYTPGSTGVTSAYPGATMIR